MPGPSHANRSANSQMNTHYVFPRQPTILAGRDCFELSHNNLFTSANVSWTSCLSTCSYSCPLFIRGLASRSAPHTLSQQTWTSHISTMPSLAHSLSIHYMLVASCDRTPSTNLGRSASTFPSSSPSRLSPPFPPIDPPHELWNLCPGN